MKKFLNILIILTAIFVYCDCECTKGDVKNIKEKFCECLHRGSHQFWKCKVPECSAGDTLIVECNTCVCISLGGTSAEWSCTKRNCNKRRKSKPYLTKKRSDGGYFGQRRWF